MIDDLFITALKRHLPNRLTMFDIGARGGVHDRWKALHQVLSVIGFEPELDECRALNESAKTLPYQARFLPYALGEKTGSTVPFYTCRKPGCSSSYAPNCTFLKDFPFAPNMLVTSTSQMEIRSLTDVCLQERCYPDMIKIDVQGAELGILRGGVDVLGQAKVVELEVEFNPQYLRQPLFHDVDQFMVGQGWRLLGLRRDYWRRAKGLDRTVSGCGGQLIHGDALYYHATDLEKQGLSTEDVLKYALILSAYRQNDFVLSLLQHTALVKGLTGAELGVIRDAIVEKPSKIGTVLRWALSGMSHRSRRRLIDSVQLGDATDWHDADFY